MLNGSSAKYATRACRDVFATHPQHFKHSSIASDVFSGVHHTRAYYCFSYNVGTYLGMKHVSSIKRHDEYRYKVQQRVVE